MTPLEFLSFAAVKAGMGITVMPHTMVPEGLRVVDVDGFPTLEDTHISILKHRADNTAINALEGFILARLKNNLFFKATFNPS